MSSNFVKKGVPDESFIGISYLEVKYKEFSDNWNNLRRKRI
jgi:hypothetical protein